MISVASFVVMTNTSSAPLDFLTITDGKNAAVLLQHPLRAQLLARAAEPISATELAAALGVPRQRMNYHVRQLVKAGFLTAAGRRMKRNLVERQYVATARSYALSSRMLGALAGEARRLPEQHSLPHALMTASVMQGELTAIAEAAANAGVRVRVSSMTTELRFDRAASRAEFAASLLDAVANLIGKHASADASSTPPGSYRLVVGLYPMPEG
jgi:hypothetical protein